LSLVSFFGGKLAAAFFGTFATISAQSGRSVIQVEENVVGNSPPIDQLLSWKAPAGMTAWSARKNSDYGAAAKPATSPAFPGNLKASKSGSQGCRKIRPAR
jgi:hypothetical protein